MAVEMTFQDPDTPCRRRRTLRTYLELSTDFEKLYCFAEKVLTEISRPS